MEQFDPSQMTLFKLAGISLFLATYKVRQVDYIYPTKSNLFLFANIYCDFMYAEVDGYEIDSNQWDELPLELQKNDDSRSRAIYAHEDHHVFVIIRDHTIDECNSFITLLGLSDSDAEKFNKLFQETNEKFI